MSSTAWASFRGLAGKSLEILGLQFSFNASQGLHPKMSVLCTVERYVVRFQWPFQWRNGGGGNLPTSQQMSDWESPFWLRVQAAHKMNVHASAGLRRDLDGSTE